MKEDELGLIEDWGGNGERVGLWRGDVGDLGFVIRGEVEEVEWMGERLWDLGFVEVVDGKRKRNVLEEV